MSLSIALRGTAETNRVLRNAFSLLALSLIPTTIGVWAGMAIGLPALIAGNAVISSIAFLVGMFAMLYLVQKNSNSLTGVWFTFAFTFLMGAWLSGLLSAILQLPNAMGIVSSAGLGTAAIVAATGIYASTTKRDFSGIGGFLIGSVFGLIALSLMNMFFFEMPIISLAISAIAVLIFSAFMVFDVQRVVNGGETNYIMAATSIYINIFNIFSSLLQIFGFLGSDE